MIVLLAFQLAKCQYPSLKWGWGRGDANEVTEA
jgi:hypothetical protein